MSKRKASIIFALFMCPWMVRGLMVASLDLQADYWILWAAPPAFIAAVSHLAQDPAYCLYAPLAKKLPAHHGKVEEIALLPKDTLLIAGFGDEQKHKRLRELGFKIIVIPTPANNLQMQSALDKVKNTFGSLPHLPPVSPQSNKTILLKVPGGFVCGRQTPLGYMIHAAGFQNAYTGIGCNPLSREDGFLLKPDLILDQTNVSPVFLTGCVTPPLIQAFNQMASTCI